MAIAANHMKGAVASIIPDITDDLRAEFDYKFLHLVQFAIPTRQQELLALLFCWFGHVVVVDLDKE
jgi:hypothetical protein